MKKLLMVLFVCLSFSLFAQYPILVDLIAPMPLFNYMGVNSFNPDEPGSQPIFLQASIHLENPANPYTGEYMIRIQISWGSATAEVDLIPDDPLFPILGWDLNNQDFINNDPPNFNTSGDYDDFIDEIEDILLSTGKMPDGDYVFTLQVLTPNEDPLSSINSVTIQIVSPLAIALFTPGAPLGLPLVQIPTQFPEFSWISNFDEYEIFIYELNENITTPEEIEALSPYHQDVAYSSFYSYPSSANTLNLGTTYAWQVTAETVTPMTSQNVTMKSTFYVFQYSQGSVVPPIDPVVILNLINQFAATGEGAAELLNLLNNGYNVQTIMWQGQEITLEELMALLNSGQYTPVE